MTVQNEKYIGDALLQKTYIADIFTHQAKKNLGELPKYYVHDCHPAIIDRETFQKVQEEIARRASLRKTSARTKTVMGKYSGKYVLNDLLVCGECGSPYRRVIWTQKGVKRVVWRCINRLEHGRRICKQSPTLDEGDVHAAVVDAMNEMFDQQAAKEMVSKMISFALAGDSSEMSLPAVERELRRLQDRQMELFGLAVAAGPDCLDYDEEISKVNLAKTRLMGKKAELERDRRTAEEFDRRMEEISGAMEQTNPSVTAFDEITIRQLVSNIKVINAELLLVRFKDGTEIYQTIGERKVAV